MKKIRELKKYIKFLEQLQNEVNINIMDKSLITSFIQHQILFSQMKLRNQESIYNPLQNKISQKAYKENSKIIEEVWSPSQAISMDFIVTNKEEYPQWPKVNTENLDIIYNGNRTLACVLKTNYNDYAKCVKYEFKNGYNQQEWLKVEAKLLDILVKDGYGDRVWNLKSVLKS